MSKNITLKSCVEFAVNTESELSDYYNHLSEQCAEDPELVELFKTLSQDEEIHKKQFEKLLEKVSDDDEGLPPEENDFLLAMSLSKTFADFYGRKEFVYEKNQREKLLFELFEFEKAALGFYTALKEIMHDDDILKQIVDIEKRHVVAIMKMVVTETKFTALEDDWA
jgi:rubrerythrin